MSKPLKWIWHVGVHQAVAHHSQHSWPAHKVSVLIHVSILITLSHPSTHSYTFICLSDCLFTYSPIHSTRSSIHLLTHPSIHQPWPQTFPPFHVQAWRTTRKEHNETTSVWRNCLHDLTTVSITKGRHTIVTWTMTMKETRYDCIRCWSCGSGHFSCTYLAKRHHKESNQRRKLFRKEEGRRQDIQIRQRSCPVE